MPNSTFWNSYLSPGLDGSSVQDKFNTYNEGFSQHRETITCMINMLQPSSVAILGSGFLNDIPVSDLVQQNRDIYFVDWIDDISQLGMSRSIIHKEDDGGYSCLFCSHCTGPEYCRNFTDVVEGENVCSEFEAEEHSHDACKKYQPTEQPKFIKADITAGVGRSFSEKIEKRLNNCKTVKDAILKASAIIDNFEYRPIPVATDSIELATSSMVLSQFDFEPYSYFTNLLIDRFGKEEIVRHEAKLTPLLETLRDKLFLAQVESHIKEMYRIIKKDLKPRIYLSAELFHSQPGTNQYFLVHQMPMALELIGKYFYFDFDQPFPDDALIKSQVGEAWSVTQCYLLTPKQSI